MDKTNKGNYSSAVKDFEKLPEEEKSKMTEQFKEQTKKIKDDFVKGTIDKITAIEDSIPVKIVGTRLDRNSINDQILNVQLNNKSDKPTKQINFVVFAYDKNKLPVKLNFGYDDYRAFKLDTPLQPGETSKSNWTWDLYPHGNEVAEVVVVLNEVEFFEGEKWVNPALSASIEKYSGKPLK